MLTNVVSQYRWSWRFLSGLGSGSDQAAQFLSGKTPPGFCQIVEIFIRTVLWDFKKESSNSIRIRERHYTRRSFFYPIPHFELQPYSVLTRDLLWKRLIAIMFWFTCIWNGFRKFLQMAEILPCWSHVHIIHVRAKRASLSNVSKG